jgi:hypothetical protein
MYGIKKLFGSFIVLSSLHIFLELVSRYHSYVLEHLHHWRNVISSYESHIYIFGLGSDLSLPCLPLSSISIKVKAFQIPTALLHAAFVASGLLLCFLLCDLSYLLLLIR